MAIRNYRELSQKLNDVVEKAQQRLTNAAEIFLKTNIEHFYYEYPEPELYVRQYHFLNSPEKIDVQKIGTAYFSSVGLSNDYLNMRYEQSNNPGMLSPPPTGKEVAEVANEYPEESANSHMHSVEPWGGYTSDYVIFEGKGFWNRTLDTTYEVSISKEYAKWITQYTGCKCVKK